MDVKYAVADLRDALTNRLFPTITTWNRLEGRPRRADFDRALKAEVRDALWMLTKQWQIGEFKADDAGSPVLLSTVERTEFGNSTIRFRAIVPRPDAGASRSSFWPDGRIPERSEYPRVISPLLRRIPGNCLTSVG